MGAFKSTPKKTIPEDESKAGLQFASVAQILPAKQKTPATAVGLPEDENKDMATLAAPPAIPKRGYVAGSIALKDPDEFFRVYLPMQNSTLEPFGGKVIVMHALDPDITEQMGTQKGAGFDKPGKMVFVVQFDSFAKALSWFTGPEYGKIVTKRDEVADFCLTVVEENTEQTAHVGKKIADRDSHKEIAEAKIEQKPHTSHAKKRTSKTSSQITLPKNRKISKTDEGNNLPNRLPLNEIIKNDNDNYRPKADESTDEGQRPLRPTGKQEKLVVIKESELESILSSWLKKYVRAEHISPRVSARVPSTQPEERIADAMYPLDSKQGKRHDGKSRFGHGTVDPSCQNDSQVNSL